MERAKNQGDYASLNDWLDLSRLVLKKIDDERLSGHSEESLNSEMAASLLNSSIVFCNVIVSGEEAAIGLKYDEENMFAPMIIFLEKGAAAETLVRAAGDLGVAVVKNNLLAKNLASYGKAGSPVPEASYRDVSLALTRSNSLGGGGRSKVYGQRRRNILVEVPRPISLEMGESLYSLTGEEPGRKKLLADALEIIRKKLVKLLGFNIGNFRISKNSELKTDEYRILFKGLEAGQGRLELGWYVASIPEMMTKAENVSAAARAASSLLIRHIDEIIQCRAGELLGRDEVDAILEAAEEKYPVVCAEVKSLLSLGIIREILQTLVSEHVSIRHIALILETLADWCNFGPAPSEVIVAQIRLALKRQICLDYTDDKLTLRVLTLEAELDKTIANYPSGISAENDGGPGAWLELISSALGRMEKKGYPPVILCSPRARFSLKEITRRELPYLAVLSYGEIPSDIKVEPLGEIGFGGD